MKTKRKYFLLLLIVGSFLFLFELGGRDLLEPDETRYAVVAREMRECGNWIIPHLNGAVYQEKPPLFFWLVNISTFFFRGNAEMANRLPSALAGLITILVVFFFGSKLFNVRTGFLSSLVLATCFFFPQISRWMMLDSTLTLFFLLAIYHLYFGMSEKGKEGRHFLLAGIFMGLATLTKGPIGYLPILIVLIYAMMVKEARKVWNRNLFYAVLISVGIVTVWFLPAILVAGKSYRNEMLSHQIIGRFAEGWSHPEPFYFYFVRLPLGFLPWIFFLPWVLHRGFSSLQKEKTREFLFLFIWFSFLFLFFSLSKGKKDNYLLPIYPCVAMLIGEWCSFAFWSGEERKKIEAKSSISITLIMLLSLIPFLIVLLADPQTIPEAVLHYLPLALWPLLYVSLGGLLSLIFLLKKRNPLSLLSLVVALIVAQIHLSILVPSQLNRENSLKQFCGQILLRMAPGDELKIWKFQSTGILYYTGRPVEQIKTINRLLQVVREPRRIFMVAEEEDFSRLQSRVELPFHLIDREKIGHKRWLLVSNQDIPVRGR